MYALPSKNALEQRRSKWTSDRSDKSSGSVAANAVARARADITQSSSDTTIFSAPSNNPYTMDATDDDSESRARASKLEQCMASVTHIVGQHEAILQRLDALELSLTRALEQVAALELAQSQAQSQAQVKPVIAPLSLTASTLGITPALESSVLASMIEPASGANDSAPVDSSPSFVPYFIKEQYTGRDNATRLEGDRLIMTVEILSYYPDLPVIYPFGTNTSIPKFSDLTLNCNIADLDDKMSGTVYGDLRRNASGVYTLALKDLYVDGELTTFDKCPYPIILKCDTQLMVE